jgi:hypothetical protein
MFGGPTHGEEGLAGQSTNLAATLGANFSQNYANQQATLARLGATINMIQSGQTGPGFSSQEDNAFKTNIVNQGAAAARNAQQATADRFAGAGSGGGSGVSTGAARQIAGQIASSTGAATSNALISEQAANMQQGRTNAIQTESALQAIQGDFGNIAQSSLAGEETQNQLAYKQQSDIQAQEVARSQAIAGTIMKGVGAVAGGFAGGLGAGGGFMDTLKGFAGGALGDGGQFLTTPQGGGGGGSSMGGWINGEVEGTN